MHCDDHERARGLADRSLVEGISPDDQRWLDRHTAGCAPCAEHAQETARLLSGLHALSFELDPALTQRTRQAIAGRVHGNRLRTAAWVAAAAVIVAAVPLYHGIRERWQESTDSALMQEVDARLSQTVPAAMQALQSPGKEGK